MSDSLFLEDQALHAALNDDEQALDQTLEKMLPGELVALARAADTLSSEARWKAQAMRQRQHRAEAKS